MKIDLGGKVGAGCQIEAEEHRGAVVAGLERPDFQRGRHRALPRLSRPSSQVEGMDSTTSARP